MCPSWPGPDSVLLLSSECKIEQCEACFSHNFCTKCQEGLYLHKGRCYPACPEGSTAANSTMECGSPGKARGRGLRAERMLKVWPQGAGQGGAGQGQDYTHLLEQPFGVLSPWFSASGLKSADLRSDLRVGS